ncbi:MAG TPA: hypothetical protein QGF58_28035 [Myxococcota bacterium]|nr:hypothetical protein [Myxococcota bacterium]
MTAWALQQKGSERDELFLLISNSELSTCASPFDLSDIDSLDSASQEETAQELALMLYREGSRIAFLHLYRFRQDSWEGTFPLSSEPVNTILDDRDPFAAEASWWAMLEARVAQEHGLIRSYEPVEYEAEVDVPDGDVQIDRDGERFHGSFGLESLDVSGTFKASRCGVSYDKSIFPVIEAGLGATQATPDETE